MATRVDLGKVVGATGPAGGAYTKQQIVDMIYPVGSIYISLSATNPATLFGGTWKQTSKGRFLLGAGPNEANSVSYWGNYPVGTANMPSGEMGGEALHTLIQAEIPDYLIGSIPEVVPLNHWNWSNDGIMGCSMGECSTDKPGVTSNQNGMSAGTQWGYAINTHGGGAAHNNMPPYLGVYIWERTA